MNLDKLRNAAKTPLTGFLVVLAITSFLYFQRLGNPYISLYDEGAHANVVKNLAAHCCVPHLHLTDLGMGHRNWLNNTVWLHKPVLPFYVTTAVYALAGETLLGLRLPGVVLVLLTGTMIYLTGRKFLSAPAGVCGAAIFCLNPFTHKLARGLVFAGFPDLFLVFFSSVALYLVLDWSQTKSAAALRWLGVAVALAYLSKGGLALAPFAIVAAIAVLTGEKASLVPAVQSVAIFVILVLPDALYWRMHYPVEFRYEQEQQLGHLFRSIDGFGAPWDNYLTFLLPAMLNGPLVPFAYFSIVRVLRPFRPATPGFILGLWVLAYVVPLSFAVSKITNFIFPAFPALALLMPYVVSSLLRDRRFDVVLSLCVSAAIMGVLWGALYTHHNLAWIPLIAAGVTYAAAYLLAVRTKFASGTVATGALVAISLAVFSLYVYRDIWDNIREPSDGAAQASLRQTAAQLQGLVGKDGLVMTHSKLVDFAYVYVRYWSGIEAMDICRDPQPVKGIARFRAWKHLYLISDETLPSRPVARLATGYLYSLDQIPFEVWSPVATGVCEG